MSGEAGDATAVDAADAKRDAPAESAASRMSAQAMSIPACYALSGYEDDPCLPADDSLLPWLSNVPKGCAVRVEAGPFFANDGQGRSCCYFVGCDVHPAKAPNALP